MLGVAEPDRDVLRFLWIDDPTSKSPQEVAEKMVSEFTCCFGILHSDQGTNFESRVFVEICKLFKIEKKKKPSLKYCVQRLVKTKQMGTCSFPLA